MIDGSASKLFQPSDSAFLVCTGTEYITIGFGQGTTFSYSAYALDLTGAPTTVTLTASQASNLIQEYTGTLSNNVSVIFPPVVNLYVISNQANLAGNTLQVKTATGTAVTIPSASQVTVICDGVNFYNANTTQIGATAISLIDGTAGAPALNFTSQNNTGVFKPGGNAWAVSVIGTQRFTVTTSGITVNGTGTFSGGISGGVF